MADKKELSEAQKLMAKIAGIPADRPGLGAEYPRMLYKPGVLTDHQLLGEDLKVQGKHAVESVVVENLEEEMEATAEGWSRSPDGVDAISEVLTVSIEKDARIAELEAMLAAQDAPRRGRPPRVQDDVQSSEE